MSTQSVKESRSIKLAGAAEDLVASALESSFDAATFFAKFESLLDTPNAIFRIKECILELAIRGELAESRTTDGTVASRDELREAVGVCARKLGVRPTAKSPEIHTLPFQVPSNWRWCLLADIGVAQTGGTPSKSQGDVFGGDVPFIKPADIFPNSVDYANERLTLEGAKSGSRIAPKNSLLMVCIGTIGKCNLIEQECAFNQQINSLTPVPYIEPRFYFTLLERKLFSEWLGRSLQAQRLQS